MKIIARNKKAYRDYDILEKVESGILLSGAEVKSLRAGKVNLMDSYAQCIRGEIFINHLHVSTYDQSGLYTPDPYRRRKLLLHKRQIEHLCSEVQRKQLTLIPLSIYFKNQWVKIELGLCRGRKKHDKRQKIAEKESNRRIAQLMKSRR
ncbi:SsrA-binding protein SmpB [Chitinispirillales bacterium ANBcel5]|uniref:SsrA-binding protein SmpB n=1 Tax=Cellulosispirillum alkaliphilum TaxID=3039283 RepID=UPI002A57ADEC|nr:SsrA-binding protein SmpB [Chitinispirillales bacterium ANBcel5]